MKFLLLNALLISSSFCLSMDLPLEEVPPTPKVSVVVEVPVRVRVQRQKVVKKNIGDKISHSVADIEDEEEDGDGDGERENFSILINYNSEYIVCGLGVLAGFTTCGLTIASTAFTMSSNTQQDLIIAASVLGFVSGLLHTINPCINFIKNKE
jgi:hypothetical protein